MASNTTIPPAYPPTIEDDEDQLVDVDDVSSTSQAPTVGENSLAKDETKAVRFFRIVLMLLLLFTALAVSLVSFFLAAESEQQDFVTTFEGHAAKILDTFESDAAAKRTALIHLSREYTSHAKFANETWPFVTLPDFERKVSLTLELAEVIGVFLLPLVTDDNVEQWGQYSIDNQQWYWDGMAIQKMNGVKANNTGAETFMDDDEEGGHFFHGYITRFDDSEDGNSDLNVIDESARGPFFPVWQFSPQIPVSIVGADFSTLLGAKKEIKAYLDDPTKRNIVGPSFGFELDDGATIFLNLLLERWENGGNRYVGGPLSFYYIPVYADFTESAPLVGVLMNFVYWQTYFKNLLPDTARGVHVVLENTCEQMFTFSVSGAVATFVGIGDLHDTTYDDLEASNDFGSFLRREPADNGGCYYKLRIYPTDEFASYHLTYQPFIISISIFGVFVFTALVFVLYDRFVEKRQRLVMKSAKQSGDVVDSLFPDNVRERLYAKDSKNRDTPQGLTTRFGGNLLGGSDASTSTDPSTSGSPIADLYPNCTVFFSDLAGFTKWSSTRTPCDVFLLLETLYGAFDKIAKKLGVFKVETIGDCYVAVTGLPKPQENHALIMCRFAASCMFKMNQLVNSENVLLSLGDDTSDLEMRVGMHSGPVTAGVLRGEKARFQLFGDTVNTASRMESNGQKGRMQVSQATADLLVAAGKEKWLTAREDLVEAKGKGKMQTYWVSGVTANSDPSVMGSIMSSSFSSGDAGARRVPSSLLGGERNVEEDGEREQHNDEQSL